MTKTAGKSSMATELAKIKIVYCYAHKDKAYLEALDRHLGTLKRLGQITTWHDREILPGGEWRYEINSQLLTADIVLLLISPNFISSNYCYSVEMQRVLRRRELGKVHVIPIILRPVDWKETPLSDLQLLPTEGKPITMWRNRDEAFQDVVKGIRKVIEILSTQKGKGRRRYQEDIYIPLSEKELQEALAIQEEAIRFNPYNAYAWSQKAKILLELEDYHKVLTVLEQAIRLNPNNAEFYWRKGDIIDYLFNDLDKALALYEEAIRLDPANPYPQFRMSLVLLFLGRDDDALRAIKKAIELDPDNPLRYEDTKEIILEALEKWEKET